MQDKDMTIIEANNLLIDFFCENDAFELDRDFKKVILITENEEQDKAILAAALATLEAENIVIKASTPSLSTEKLNKIFWVLVRPFNTISQTLQISAATGNNLSKILNAALQGASSDSELCNPCKVTERDINNLLLLCLTYSKEIGELNKEASQSKEEND